MKILLRVIWLVSLAMALCAELVASWGGPAPWWLQVTAFAVFAAASWALVFFQPSGVQRNRGAALRF